MCYSPSYYRELCDFLNGVILKVININGFELNDLPISTDAFNHVGNACTERFQDIFDEDFLHGVVVVNDQNDAIGYCSYWGEYGPHPIKDNITILYFQIDYVYLEPNYRGKNISSLLAKALAEGIYLLNSSEQRVKQLVDNSQYVSDEGFWFGKRLYRKLEEKGFKLFNSDT